VAVEELPLYFVVIPALGYAASLTWLRISMRKIAERQLGFLREPGVNSRFLVMAQLFLFPVLLGLVIFIQLLGVPEGPRQDSVVRSLGFTWGVAAILTALSEASVFVRWRASAFHENFAPVLVLAVLPETVILFVFAVAFMTIGPLKGTLTQTRADNLISATRWMLVGSLSAPVTAFLANRPRVLDKKSFGRVVAGAATGVSLVVVCLVLASLEIAKA